MSQQEAPSSLSMERGNSPTGADGEVMQVDEDEDTSFAVTDSVPLLGPRGPNGEWELGSGSDMEDDDSDHCHLDCYPYTFTPLLLFAPSSYFDKGYSNYNSVASFFGTQLPCNMLDNVLYERKNMIYEELLDHVVQHQMLVVCCIDAHFTAFQVICHPKKPKKKHLLYYDPLKASLQLVSNEDFKKFALFQLMKCHYGDSQHIQEHKDHYTSPLEGNPTRRLIYSLWKKINSLDSVSDLYIQTKTAPLNLNRWLLINSKTNPRQMSTQLTGNTCYFQTFLFAVLCKICNPYLNSTSGPAGIGLDNLDLLETTTAKMCRFVLEFFVQHQDGGTVLRPLTNSNFILDFWRFESAPYFSTFLAYLEHSSTDDMFDHSDSSHNSTPNYPKQYSQVLEYYQTQKILHTYGKFTLEGCMSSTPNTKSLQFVCGTDDATRKLAQMDYYKYRPVNLMFGFNAGIFEALQAFCEFNSLRKNQLLGFFAELQPALANAAHALQQAKKATKYRDYYFMPQFEVGQQELVDVHHYSIMIDICAMMPNADPSLLQRVRHVNQILVDHIYYSTQKRANYEKMIPISEFIKTKPYRKIFLNTFLSLEFLEEHVALGFAEINPKEKEINSLTQTVFYTTELMGQQANRQSFEFEKECINQMARSNLRRYTRRFEGYRDPSQKYKVHVTKIGYGYTYSKYNTLMHFLNVAQCYWMNPDLSNIQVFGKDIRTLIAISCQKIFFQKGAQYYHYGPMEMNQSGSYRGDLDLAVATSLQHITPTVSQVKRNGFNNLVLTDRVYEFHYLKEILTGVFARANGARFKSDNEVINLCLLSLMLDFGLYDVQHTGLLNLPWLQCLQHAADTRELQVEVANLIYEFDRKNTSDSVTRGQVEELLYEASYKFLVNKDFPVQSKQFKLIRMLNSDPDYQSYILLCKIYMSLCQINKSVEVDYYKIHCDGEFRIIIPANYSKTTGEYLDEVTKQYTFSEIDNVMIYDELPVFDLRPHQPQIHLHRVRFDSATEIQSMVKYIEIGNAFHVVVDVDEEQNRTSQEDQYLVFIANNVLLIQASSNGKMKMNINKIPVEVATIFFNEAISFVPCFKYAESEDVVLFTSRNIHYMVDKGGQFCTDYYGMKHDLIECIKSDEVFVDLNDEHVFKSFKLSELLTESKTVLYFPDYLLQLPDRQHLINLLDLAIHLRNVSFFILVLFYLRRSSVALQYVDKEGSVVKITGPWREAILYVLNRASPNSHYDKIFEKQFFDLNQHEDLPLEEFIEVLCENFTKYQRFTEDNEYQIIPRPKQKAFLKRIICAEECFHFSEVGSGKTKVILPLLCQIFLSNNKDAHKYLARGGKKKDVLIILVPEHLVSDARTQVYRYCLNLNFREEYRVYDDIFALLHQSVTFGSEPIRGRFGSVSQTKPMKQIFVTSFNSFKKALTYDKICNKVQPHRDHILVVADEVDDFLDRNKLVFNICSNKSNAFDRPTLDQFFETSRAAYHGNNCLEESLISSPNPEYWKELFKKFVAIHAEIQDASRSINKSFGIFNEHTLRHCSTNIVHDIEGYKSLIARPYESVNRAMPGSYYSDVERTIYLTYVILSEDIAKYDELFQAERKFISFEYWNTHFLHMLDFDDLVYGHEQLSEIAAKHPEAKDGLIRFLYEIILRRMEIRDKSRSVNSIDIIFNFDCIGFTGTPFLDNYPTFDYIRNERKDDIPDLIDRNFYAYSSEALQVEEFEERFARFQGQNNNVFVEYVSSDFIGDSSDEMKTLEIIFDREESGSDTTNFNAIVDLCGIFKQSTIHDVRNVIKKRFGADKFDYVYHIDQTDNNDRVLCLKSDNDVQYDEEFYKYLCKTYGENLREKVFFFVDNRNVIGKDIPFQLVYHRHYGQPLFTKSVVLAHDVDDFSKIWQAMGRSRTMNDTVFSIYKSSFEQKDGMIDIKNQELTRHLYVHNCDCKMAGNISSIFLTLIALLNLSQGSFYYCDEIVNTFLEKMEKTISGKVKRHQKQLVSHVLGNVVPQRILLHIIMDKFKRSSNTKVTNGPMTEDKLETLLRQIVEQKYEQRQPSGDVYDDFIRFLSGEQQSLMEISYTKQQQKQKQKQNTKNQDSDAMGLFDKKNRLPLAFEVDDYFKYTLRSEEDLSKMMLNLPCPIPILSIDYNIDGNVRPINVYPTLQFLYSHHIHAEYITHEVQKFFQDFDGDKLSIYNSSFLDIVEKAQGLKGKSDATIGGSRDLGMIVRFNNIRQNPQYSIAGIQEGVYIIGMKDQFNVFDMQSHSHSNRIQYVADEMGFVLFDRTTEKNVDRFGPYYIEQYILMEVLSKQEVAQNVMDYYCNHKTTLQRGLDNYAETQGKGFICWRFLINETAKASAFAEMDTGEDSSSSGKRSSPLCPIRYGSVDESTSATKRPRASNNGGADEVADGFARASL